jgi:hypothetical protein
MSVPDAGYSNLMSMSAPDVGYSNLMSLSLPDASYSNLMSMSVLVTSGGIHQVIAIKTCTEWMIP